MSNGDVPTDLIKKLSESYRQVRLGRGVVGKTGHAIMALMAVWLVVAWRLSDSPWVNASLILVGLAATAVFAWWVKSTQDFVQRNPAQALLEGAELLEYQKFEAQVKGGILLDQSSPVSGSSISSGASGSSHE